MALVISEKSHLGILVAAVLASTWLAYSGPRPGEVPGLLPLFAVVIALTPLLLNLLTRATPGPGARYAAIFGIAWFGINPANAPTLAQPGCWLVLCSALGMITGLVLYQWHPQLRQLGIFLAPVIAAAFCDRATLAFGPLLFAYIFLFEEDAHLFAIPASLARSLPAVLVSLISLRLPPAPALPLDSKIAEAGHTLLVSLAPWNPTALPGQDASTIVMIVLAGVACYTALWRHTRALSFGLWWFLIVAVIVPAEPLLASIGLALAAAAVVARAVALAPRQELRLVAAGCLCLLLLGGAGIAQRNVQAFEAPPASAPATAPATAPTTAPTVAQDTAPQPPPTVLSQAPSSLSAEQLLRVSLSLYQAGRFSESIAAAQAALRINPNFAVAYNNIAAAHAALRQWDEAIVAAQQALRLQPDFTLARNNLNWALEQKRLGR
jgi:hypothetical protein